MDYFTSLMSSPPPIQELETAHEVNGFVPGFADAPRLQEDEVVNIQPVHIPTGPREMLLRSGKKIILEVQPEDQF